MINLLPSEEKEWLIWGREKKIILILGISVLFFLISLILVLTSIKIYTSSQVEIQKFILSQGEKKFDKSEDKIFQEKLGALNQELVKLESFYKNQTDLIEIFEKISSTTPPGINIYSFSFTADNPQISLIGLSSTREALLKFEESLEAEKKFVEVSFPPNSWIEPTNINFNVNFKISK